MIDNLMLASIDLTHLEQMYTMILVFTDQDH